MGKIGKIAPPRTNAIWRPNIFNINDAIHRVSGDGRVTAESLFTLTSSAIRARSHSGSRDTIRPVLIHPVTRRHILYRRLPHPPPSIAIENSGWLEDKVESRRKPPFLTRNPWRWIAAVRSAKFLIVPNLPSPPLPPSLATTTKKNFAECEQCPTPPLLAAVCPRRF